jgi:hypothetical protein
MEVDFWSAVVEMREKAANEGALSGNRVEDEHGQQYARQAPSKHLGCGAFTHSWKTSAANWPVGSLFALS